MISDFTRRQLQDLILHPSRPLLICDVDEVIVHFVREFEDYLGERDLTFKVNGFQLTNDSVITTSGEPLGIDPILSLINSFFAERTISMKPIEGAVESIQTLSSTAQVVFLTNLPAEAGDARRKNLADFGLGAPVITNTGPKGPAIKFLAEQVKAPIAFIDDSPGFIQSSNEFAPQVKTVHFLHDERFHPHVPHFDFLGLRSDNWTDASAFLHKTLAGA